jgi:hypothetical protein
MKAPKREREIFKKLIPIYEQAINEMPKDDRWLMYLFDKKLLFGLCSVCEDILGDYYLNKSLFILKNTVLEDGFIHKPPFYCKTYKQALKTLKYRLDFMKKHI